MKKLLYTIGDSFVYGMECLGDRDRSLANKNFAFPKYIADSLGCEIYINNSYPGAPNSFIFKQAVFDILNLENIVKNPKDVFVVIGITSLHRIEVSPDFWLQSNGSSIKNFLKMSMDYDPNETPAELADHGVLFCNPGSFIRFSTNNSTTASLGNAVIPFCTKFIWYESVLLKLLEAEITALHEILKAKGYDHIFVNTVCPLERTTDINLNTKNFYNLGTDSFQYWAKINFPEELKEMNHYSTRVHEEYAKLLMPYILKNCIA